MPGQINFEEDVLGRAIVDICKQPDVRTIVEVGAWNGLGTTRCVLHGLKEGNKTDFSFTSLECSPDRYIEAVNNNHLAISKNFNILYGKIVSETMLGSWFDINSLRVDQKSWLVQNISWMMNVPDVSYALPDKIDFLILDGGEFSTFLEWEKLKSRTRYCALDDTRELKCNRIRTEILASPDYRVIIDDTSAKNGAMVVENLKW